MSEKRDEVGNNVIYLDTIYFHKVETETPNKPKKPLTKAEKKRLEKLIYKKCRKAYINAMTKSGLKNSAYLPEDLENDSYIHFHNILNKFDKDAYGKAIGKEYVEGPSGQKTLDWFFYNYYCWRLNWTKKDNRNLKDKKMGTEQYNPVAFVDVEAQETSGIRYSDGFALLTKELAKKPSDFQEFFKRKVVLEEKASDLKDDFPNYKELSAAVKLFLNDFLKRNKEVLKSEIGPLKKAI